MTNNSAGTEGGGIYGYCTVSGTRVIGNRAGSGYVGGIYGLTAQITNCVVWDNPGGGVALQSGFVKHCSICNNPRGASPCGTGVYICGSGATVANNVVAGHEKNIFEANTPDPAAVKNNLLSQASICQYWVNGAVPLNTEAEINNLIYCQNNLVRPDPLFIDAAAGDLHLQAGSPCIDAGSATDSSPTDYDKNARPFGAAPDIGAYEWGYALPPHWPASPVPPDGATNVDIHNLFLQWGGAERATQYDVFLWPANTVRPDIPSTSGLAQPSCPVAGLWPAADYWWQVVARNDAGATPGNIWTFHTGIAAPPSLGPVSDGGDATAQLQWAMPPDPPAQFLGFAWDIYQANWVQRFWNNTMWQPFAAGASSGSMDLGLSGAYHVWISSQYFGGYWIACTNPWTGIIYSGTPHTPLNVTVENRGGLNVRLHWKPEIYGTWHDQIIAYKVGDDFVSTAGPSGDQLWHFIDYGALAYDTSKASFLNGWADFTLPSAGDYWLFIRGVGWLPPYPAGEYGTAFVSVP
ncbi:MAG: right-handed parallel beta-helix repeat-containing protein [Candidatus Sumerlaeota bacterium]|nr:right-handed parallel beta-helix repeat-containing protein [Candidatus Sumerlaeota bacterium]